MDKSCDENLGATPFRSTNLPLKLFDILSNLAKLYINIMLQYFIKAEEKISMIYNWKY